MDRSYASSFFKEILGLLAKFLVSRDLLGWPFICSPFGRSLRMEKSSAHPGTVSHSITVSHSANLSAGGILLFTYSTRYMQHSDYDTLKICKST